MRGDWTALLLGIVLGFAFAALASYAIRVSERHDHVLLKLNDAMVVIADERGRARVCLIVRRPEFKDDEPEPVAAPEPKKSATEKELDWEAQLLANPVYGLSCSDKE